MSRLMSEKNQYMIQETLVQLFIRDLTKLKTELEAYTLEKNMWLLEDTINNTAGNLALHLIGNLNAFVGAELGNTGYIRKRDLEFSLNNVPREELVQQIDATIAMVKESLSTLSTADLQKEYPLVIFNNTPMQTEFFLVHLSTHLAYHLGQINYHRRLLDR